MYQIQIEDKKLEVKTLWITIHDGTLARSPVEFRSIRDAKTAARIVRELRTDNAWERILVRHSNKGVVAEIYPL